MAVCDAQHTFILMTSRNKSDWRFKAPSSKGYSTIGSILPRSLDRILRNSFSTSLPVWGTGPSRWATCFLHRGLLARTCPRSNRTWYLQTLNSTLKTREWPNPTNRRALNLAPLPANQMLIFADRSRGATQISLAIYTLGSRPAAGAPSRNKLPSKPLTRSNLAVGSRPRRPKPFSAAMTAPWTPTDPCVHGSRK